MLSVLFSLLAVVASLLGIQYYRRQFLYLSRSFKDFFYRNPKPMWMFDSQTLKFISVNTAALSYYGYTEEEFMNMTLFDIRPPEERERFEKTVNTIPSGTTSAGIWIHKRKNGALLYTDITVRNIKWKNKIVKISLINDVTELVVAKNNLQKTNSHLEEMLLRYDTLTEATQEAVWEYDLISNEVIWNRGIETIFGYRNPAMSADTWFEKIHKDDLERVKSSLDRVMQNHLKTWAAAYQFLCADETYKLVENNAVVIFNKKGDPVRIIGSMQDVTLKYQQEAEIKKLSLIAQTASNAIIVIDGEGYIDWVNDAFVTMTGFTPEEAKGRKTPHLLHGQETDKQTESEIRELIQAKVRFSKEILHYRKDGSKYWVDVHFSPLITNGKLQNTICIHSDITEKKERERRIEEQNLRLKQIAFTNSHILRAPVANIIAFTNLLATNSFLQKEEKEIITYLTEASNTLDSLIRNIAKRAEEV